MKYATDPIDRYALQQGANPVAPANEETVSTVFDSTLKYLFETRNALESLITKHLGPRPSGTGEQSKEPARSLRHDAYLLRGLATEISEQVALLHQHLGY